MDRVLNNIIATEVRAEVGRQCVSKTELARRLGRSDRWVARRLSGNTAMTLDDLEGMAAALSVPVQRFLADHAAAA